uniref:Ovule protein n=1 Tax=Panagrolaimus davidi TaxID=227884 RepID=A0A914PRZ1_9BILA
MGNYPNTINLALAFDDQRVLSDGSQYFSHPSAHISSQPLTPHSYYQYGRSNIHPSSTSNDCIFHLFH